MSKNNPNKGEMVTKARQHETDIAELKADRDEFRAEREEFLVEREEARKEREDFRDECDTARAEAAARSAQQPMTARADMENPGQEEREVQGLYGLVDNKKTSLRQSVIDELVARNLHWEFVIDDETTALSEYIHPGSSWSIYKDAEGKEIRVAASPSDVTQQLILVVVDKGAFDAVNEQAVRADKLRRAGTLKLQANEYVGEESTVFKG